MAPGTYNPITQAALSESTIQFFQNYYIDKAFISVLGIDLDYGVSIPSMSDALVKKAILASSNKKFVWQTIQNLIKNICQKLPILMILT